MESAPIDTHQEQLDTLMGVIEDNKKQMPDGDYLRGMNALGRLHTRTNLESGTNWHTYNEVCHNDGLFDEIITIAENITVELGGNITNGPITAIGNELRYYNSICNYIPSPENIGHNVSPHILHHALQFAAYNLFYDMFCELESIRPISCECGWKGLKKNWKMHFRKLRHTRWAESKDNHDC